MSATQGNQNTFNQGVHSSGKGAKTASSFVQQNTSNSHSVTAAVASNPTMGGSAQKASGGEKNFQVRKSYIQSNSRNPNLTGRGANTRVSVGSAQQLASGDFVGRVVGVTSKTRNHNNQIHESKKQTGLQTLTQKINATLEGPDIGNSKTAHHPQRTNSLNQQQYNSTGTGSGDSMKLKFQQLNTLQQPSKTIGSISIRNSGNGGENMRQSHTLTERQTMNTISYPDYPKSSQFNNSSQNQQTQPHGQQFATISQPTSNRVHKPQFSAKNAIEPISGPKAPPQMQNFEKMVNPGSLPPNRSRGGNRKGLDNWMSGGGGHSLDINERPNQNSYLTSKHQHGQGSAPGHHRQHTTQQFQTLSHHKTTKLTTSGNERRSIDHTKGTLSKDYYSHIHNSNPTSSLKLQQPINNAPSSSLAQHQTSGKNGTSTGGKGLINNGAKKTVSSRTNVRRSQYGTIDASGGGPKGHTSNTLDDLSYPPSNTQQLLHNQAPAQRHTNNTQKNVGGVPGSGAMTNQSMSLTRNTSQMRTANLLSKDGENKKHTNSQTIQVEKSNSSAVLQKSGQQQRSGLPGEGNNTTDMLPEGEFFAQPNHEAAQQNENPNAHRKVQNLNQNNYRKKQLQGMARNKIHLQYGSNPDPQTTSKTPLTMVKKRDSRLETKDYDPLTNGSQALTLNEIHSTKNKELVSSVSNKQSRQLHTVKNQHLSQNLGSRLSEVRRSQDMRPEDPSGQGNNNFSSVASRIALINKGKQQQSGPNVGGNNQPRLGSQDAIQKKNSQTAMINAYAKTSSGLRTASFRQQQQHLLSSGQSQQQPTAQASDDYAHKNGGKKPNASGASLQTSTKNNNYLVSPKGNQKTNMSNAVGKSMSTEDYAQSMAKGGIKHQNSSKLIKSANGNPFNQQPQAPSTSMNTDPKDEASKDIISSQGNGSQLRQNSSQQTKEKMATNSGLKVRSINSRISQAKISLAAQQDKPTASEARYASQDVRDRQSNTLSGVDGQARQNSKKAFEMVPSTGGSDEALTHKPNPSQTSAQAQQHSSDPKQGSSSTQASSSEEGKQSKTQAQPAKETGKAGADGGVKSAMNMFNVNFNMPEPQANPLKDFEPAKFASKTHGLITSYSANTHQGIQRNYNEDRVSIILNMTRPSSRKDVTNWPKCSYFAIYDGHGGSACSDFLKDQLHLIIINQESFPRDPAQALTTGCLEAERRFIEQSDNQKPMHERSGSCGIVVLIVGKECYVANVGDSRAIMSADKGKKLFLLSRDHRPNEDYEVQRIVKNGGGIYQTQSIQNVHVPGEDKPQQQFILGPHRVIPGRLSVSRTFGDIEAKSPKYGGKEGVIIAQPEISQFTVRNDFHDFIVLGCDGIFDRLSNQQVLDACWDTINSIKSSEIKNGSLSQKSVHQVSGAMADAIIKQAAIERSLDNLTIVVVSFENLQMFLSDRPLPTRLENHLFQIKEVESGATSTVVQPTPGLSDSAIGGYLNNLSQAISPGKSNELKDAISEVRTEEVEQSPPKTKERDTSQGHNKTPLQKKTKAVSRTQNQSNTTTKKSESVEPEVNTQQDSSKMSTIRSIVSSARRNRSSKPSQPLIKVNNVTRNKGAAAAGAEDAAGSLKLQSRHSERPFDAVHSQKRRAEILPKLPQAHTQDGEILPNLVEHQSSKLQSPQNKTSFREGGGTNALFSAKVTAESPKPLKKAQIANYRFSKTAKQPHETLSSQLRSSTSHMVDQSAPGSTKNAADVAKPAMKGSSVVASNAASTLSAKSKNK